MRRWCSSCTVWQHVYVGKVSQIVALMSLSCSDVAKMVFLLQRSSDYSTGRRGLVNGTNVREWFRHKRVLRWPTLICIWVCCGAMLGGVAHGEFPPLSRNDTVVYLLHPHLPACYQARPKGYCWVTVSVQVCVCQWKCFYQFCYQKKKGHTFYFLFLRAEHHDLSVFCWSSVMSSSSSMFWQECILKGAEKKNYIFTCKNVKFDFLNKLLDIMNSKILFYVFSVKFNTLCWCP